MSDITLLDEKVRELKRPFTVAAVKMKPQSVTKDKSKGLVTFYVDARLVSERLNAAVGAGAWSDTYKVIDGPAVGIPVECSLNVLGCVKTDVGQIAPNSLDDKAWKSAYSDAFKRAAVKFGVGAYLYGGPQVWVPVDVYNDKVRGFSADGVKQARDHYRKWIGAAAFKALWGEPLDHGDVEHDHVPEDTTDEFDPGRELLDGAPAASKFVQDGMSILTECDPKVNWPDVVSQAINGYFGVADTKQIPKDRFPEFGRRYANMCVKVRQQFDENAMPPITDEQIAGAVAWAFGGTVVSVSRLQPPRTDDLPDF